MNYFDPRLAKILSDIRIEQARSIRRKQPTDANSEKSFKERLGLLLIAQGERLARRKPNIA